MFLAELNTLELWATDVGNAYLESTTAKKVYIVAGPEFGEREGHILIIRKALYGLQSSGHDLAIAMKNPALMISALSSNPYNFKLKGSGPIKFLLGMEFSRDDNGILCLESKKYLQKVTATYERHFGGKPKQVYHSPLEKGEHPEMDTTDILDSEGTSLYQSLIGALQWIVTIERFDVMTVVTPKILPTCWTPTIPLLPDRFIRRNKRRGERPRGISRRELGTQSSYSRVSYTRGSQGQRSE
jgi:hypothetical protein